MTKYDLSRRRLLRASAAGAVAVGPITTGLATGTESGNGSDATSGDYRQIPCLDGSDVDVRTESSSPPLPERSRGIRPGSLMFVHFPNGTTAGCTANFVWREVDTADPNLYIGAAGHCFLPSDANASANAQRQSETDDEVYDVSELEVELCEHCTFGGTTGLYALRGTTIQLGEVAYARQKLPDGSELGHDFGLVTIPASAADAVDRSLPQWGGPHGVTNDAVAQGETVHQYGAGVGNGEVYSTQGRTGISQGDRASPESWVATTRASPGDSGAPLVSSSAPSDLPPHGENAGGILTHIVLSSDPFETGTAGTTIGRCKELASTDANLDLAVELV